MPLINCGINLILTWSANFVLSNAAVNENTTFALTDTKPYVPDDLCQFKIMQNYCND